MLTFVIRQFSFFFSTLIYSVSVLVLRKCSARIIIVLGMHHHERDATYSISWHAIPTTFSLVGLPLEWARHTLLLWLLQRLSPTLIANLIANQNKPCLPSTRKTVAKIKPHRELLGFNTEEHCTLLEFILNSGQEQQNRYNFVIFLLLDTMISFLTAELNKLRWNVM